MKYSYLKHRQTISFVLFVLTAGPLVFLSETRRWDAFWPVLLGGTVLHAAMLYLDSASFRRRLDELQKQEFRLATQLERCGATNIFLMADAREQALRNTETQRILDGGHNFSLLTLTGASYIDPAVDRHWEHLKARLELGGTFRLLLQDPFCAEKRVRDERNRPDVSIDSKLDLSAVVRLAESYAAAQVRFTSFNIYAAVFFSESGLTYDPYHLGRVGERIENRFLCFSYSRLTEVPSGSMDHYALLRSHFDYLWDQRSVTLAKFAREHRTLIRDSCGSAAATAVDRYLLRAGV